MATVTIFYLKKGKKLPIQQLLCGKWTRPISTEWKVIDLKLNSTNTCVAPEGAGDANPLHRKITKLKVTLCDFRNTGPGHKENHKFAKPAFITDNTGPQIRMCS